MALDRTSNPFGGWAFGDAPFGPRPDDQPGAGAVTIQLHAVHDEIIALDAKHNETISLHGIHDENIGVDAVHIEAPVLHGRHRETISINIGV